MLASAAHPGVAKVSWQAGLDVAEVWHGQQLGACGSLFWAGVQARLQQTQASSGRFSAGRTVAALRDADSDRHAEAGLMSSAQHSIC